jgi:hypothetical protein
MAEEQALSPAPPPIEQTPPPIDKINPAHYHGAKGLQVIDVIEAFGLDYSTGNAVKYLLRAGKKPGEDEKTELEKARWYIERRLMQMRTFK